MGKEDLKSIGTRKKNLHLHLQSSKVLMLNHTEVIENLSIHFDDFGSGIMYTPTSSLEALHLVPGFQGKCLQQPPL